jgi:hypothetical protein
VARWTVEEAKQLVQSARTLRSWGREQDALETAQGAYDTLESAGKEPYYRTEAAEILASLHLAMQEPERAVAIAERRDGLESFAPRMDRLRGRVAAARGDRETVIRTAATLRARFAELSQLWEDLEGAHWLELLGAGEDAAQFRKEWLDAASESFVLSYHLDVASLIVPRLLAQGKTARLAAARDSIQRALFAGEHSGASRERSREAADAFFELMQLVPENAPSGPWEPRDRGRVLLLGSVMLDRIADIPGGQRSTVRVELARALEGCGDHARAHVLWRDAFGYLRHLRAHGSEHADWHRAREGLVRTRRARGVLMEQEEATSLIAPALWRSFPERASRMLLEINGWFRDAPPPQPAPDRRCSFCGRTLEWAQSGSSSSLDEGVWVSLCFSCRHALASELGANAAARPDAGAVLKDVARALAGAAVPNADEVLAALEANAARARTAPEGPCSFCPDDGKRRRMWYGPDARICERCVRDAPRIGAA